MQSDTTIPDGSSKVAEEATEPPLISQSEYDLPGCEYGPEGITVYLTVRRVLLNIHAEEQNFTRSPIALEALRAAKARAFSSDPAEEAKQFEYFDETALHFLPALEKLAPKVERNERVTLADIEHRHNYTCQLEFQDEVPLPGAISRMEPHTENTPYFSESESDVGPFQTSFPKFHRAEVEIIVQNPGRVFDFVDGKVQVNRHVFFCQSLWPASDPEDVVEKYRKIQQSSDVHDHLKTSRLYGVVLDKRGALKHLLLYFIDVDQELTCDKLKKASKETRKKWAEQIERTVSRLHQLGVVWGNVNPSNVAIDKAGDATVNDFRGGYVQGWVDHDQAESNEGDLQGLERLMEYILDDQSPLRLEEAKRRDQMDEVDKTNEKDHHAGM